MFDLQGQLRRGRKRGAHGSLALGAAAGVALLAASLAAMALAAGSPTVSSLSSAKLKETIVVNAQGRTLYWLSPETTHHLLCKTNECFKFWPPLTVSSSHTKLEAGPGVHGSLGILHRDGIFQVTLRGMLLYRYYEDHAKGQVNGQGIKSFGGTWHAVTAAADPPKKGKSTGSSTPGTPSASNPSGGGGHENSGTGASGTGTSTTSNPTNTTTTSTTSKEEKAPPKEESQAEKEAREKREKEAREKREKEEKEYNEKYPGW
jgi:predicted lipoprotein with Yx(FWY)xxD motif